MQRLRLARLELTQEAISERMASANYMLTAICRSVGGGYEIDVSRFVRQPNCAQYITGDYAAMRKGTSLE